MSQATPESSACTCASSSASKQAVQSAIWGYMGL